MSAGHTVLRELGAVGLLFVSVIPWIDALVVPLVAALADPVTGALVIALTDAPVFSFVVAFSAGAVFLVFGAMVGIVPSVWVPVLKTLSTSIDADI